MNETVHCGVNFLVSETELLQSRRVDQWVLLLQVHDQIGRSLDKTHYQKTQDHGII